MCLVRMAKKCGRRGGEKGMGGRREGGGRKKGETMRGGNYKEWDAGGTVGKEIG